MKMKYHKLFSFIFRKFVRIVILFYHFRIEVLKKNIELLLLLYNIFSANKLFFILKLTIIHSVVWEYKYM